METGEVTVPVERASPQPPLLLRKAGVATPKVPCRPRTRSGVPARSEPPPRRGCSPPVPRGSEPGGFVTKLLSPARKPRAKPRSSLWGHRAPRFPPTKAGMPVPGGAHRGTVAFSLVCSDPSPRERRRRRSPGPGAPGASCARPARLSRPRQPWGTPSCHLAPSQRRTLTFPPRSSRCRLFPAGRPRPVVSAPGPGAPPTTAPAGSEPAGDPGVSPRRRRTPSAPQVMLGRQASRARPPGPGVAPTHRLPAPATAAGQGRAHAQQASSFPLARRPLYRARL